jgi:hypothetical protein
MEEEFTVTYFPYTLLDEGDLKRLCLYVARLRLVQVDPDTDPGLPPKLRAGAIIQPASPVADAPTLERIRLALRAYRQIGALRPEGGLLDCFGAFACHEDPEGSANRLRARLKGVPNSTPHDMELVNSAVFLLLAHEVDREHLELESRLGRVRVLETEVAGALGLPEDEEGRLTVAAAPVGDDLERSRSGQAAERLRAWTRLNLDLIGEDAVRPLTTSVAVMDEIWERLPPHLAAMSLVPSRTGIETHILCRLPDPLGLPLAEVLALRERLASTEVLFQWWQALAAALQTLETAGPTGREWPARRRAIEGAAGAFSAHWPKGHPACRALELSVIWYRRLPATTALALVAGMCAPAPDLLNREGKNGASLLLSPEREGGSLWL